MVSGAVGAGSVPARAAAPAGLAEAAFARPWHVCSGDRKSDRRPRKAARCEHHQNQDREETGATRDHVGDVLPRSETGGT
jgi:hypothetical protein